MSKDLGVALYEAREFLIASAKERAADLTDPADVEAFNKLADTLADAPMQWSEFYAWVERARPQYAHTLDWDECPDDWQQECYCATCISYMSED